MERHIKDKQHLSTKTNKYEMIGGLVVKMLVLGSKGPQFDTCEAFGDENC